MQFEKDIEKYFVDRIESVGGMAEKFGRNGHPDRIVLLPGKAVRFVELKRPGETLSKLQIEVHKEYKRRGHDVAVISSKGEVDRWLSCILINGNA